MKNIIYYTFIVAFASLVSACSVVDLDPSNKYSKDYGYQSQANVELYLNSFYPMIYDFGQFGSNALGGSNSSMSDGLTDILKYGGMVPGTGDCNLIMTEDGRQSVSQNYFDAWTTCYGWIRRINEFLDGLDEHKSNFSEEQYSRFRAEALFFRAYAYFLIMRSHASEKDDYGAILYTDINQMTTGNKTTARSNVSASYDRIRDDINYAVNNLPLPSAARGRLHRYAADALKARAMLYAERYSLAKEAVEDIISGAQYDYIDDYSAIFKDLTNSEVIWGYGFAKGSLTHNFDQRYSMPGDVCENGDGYGGGYAGPTQEFVDSYDYADGQPFDVSDVANRFITNDNYMNRDPRLYASVLWNGEEWKGRTLQCYPGGEDMRYYPYGEVSSPGNTVTGYYMRKLMDESNRDYILNGSYQPWIEFRYAEMMLIYAECLAYEQNYTDAWDVVNKLRQKRFNDEDVYTAPISDWESALDVILKERAVELCFEGHRFWDLRRTGRAAEVLDGKRYSGVEWTFNAGDGTFTPELVSCDMGARHYPESFDRFPIPQSEISNNGLARQNSDW